MEKTIKKIVNFLKSPVLTTISGLFLILSIIELVIITTIVHKIIDKDMINVPMVNTTIAHEVIGEFGAGRVLLKPAGEGTGVLAGGCARAVLELAGIRDIRAKSLRSNNPRNLVSATIEGLKALKVAEDVARLRGKTVEEILG